MTKKHTRYHVVAELNGELLATCEHQHRTRDAACGCKWTGPKSTVFNRLVIRPFEVESKGAGGDRGHVSVTRPFYDRMKVEVEVRNKSMSQIVEEAVEPVLAAWEQGQGA